MWGGYHPKRDRSSQQRCGARRVGGGRVLLLSPEMELVSDRWPPRIPKMWRGQGVRARGRGRPGWWGPTGGVARDRAGDLGDDGGGLPATVRRGSGAWSRGRVRAPGPGGSRGREGQGRGEARGRGGPTLTTVAVDRDREKTSSWMPCDGRSLTRGMRCGGEDRPPEGQERGGFRGVVGDQRQNRSARRR